MNWVPRYSIRSILVGITILAVLQSCSPQDGGAEVATTKPADQATSPLIVTPVTSDELANMAYSGIYDIAVTLKDGRWEGEPFVEGGASRPAVGMVDNFLLTGDLDNNGLDEAVVLLWESSGGSGVMNYVAAVGRRDGDTVNLGTALIGDRVQLRNGRIADGTIELDIIQQGPNDAACCPSQLASRFWTLDANGLNEGEAKIAGTLSLDDIAGQEWVLRHLKWNESVPVQPEVTLVFDGERLTGKSACNRYFAIVTAGDMPGDLAVSQIGGTRMACPGEVMDHESNYLEALGNVARYGFLVGKLVLTWRKDGVTNTMLFVPREHQEQ
jgi:heat shock protein HslJ